MSGILSDVDRDATGEGLHPLVQHVLVRADQPDPFRSVLGKSSNKPVNAICTAWRAMFQQQFHDSYITRTNPLDHVKLVQFHTHLQEQTNGFLRGRSIVYWR